MKPIVRDFVVGLTAIGGLVVLVIGMLFFGITQFERTYSFKVHVANAAGLAAASRVTMNGVSIGQIKDAEILSPSVGGVALTVKVRSTVRIPKKAVVGIDKGLIGDATLDFAIPKNLATLEIADYVTEGMFFEGGDPGTLFDKITSVLDKPVTRFTQTAERIEKLAEVYTNVGLKIDEALEPRTLADVAAGKQPNIRSLVERIDQTLADVDSLAGDASVKAQIKSIIARAETIMNDAQSTVTSIKQTASKVDTVVDSADKTIKDIDSATTSVKDKVAAVSDQAVSALKKTEDAAGNLAQALDAATHGGGTVGQLMQNPDLYNNLKDAAARLDRALTEFQLMVEKFKAEGIKLKL